MALAQICGLIVRDPTDRSTQVVLAHLFENDQIVRAACGDRNLGYSVDDVRKLGRRIVDYLAPKLQYDGAFDEDDELCQRVAHILNADHLVRSYDTATPLTFSTEDVVRLARIIVAYVWPEMMAVERTAAATQKIEEERKPNPDGDGGRRAALEALKGEDVAAAGGSLEDVAAAPA